MERFLKLINLKMKKKIFIGIALSVSILVLMSFFNGSKADKKSNYKVIKINGQILFVKTGNTMKRGDVFTSGTPLKFITNNSRAAVMSQSTRFILQANAKGKVKILPATSNVTSRAGALINLVDLQNHFSGRYLIFDNEKLQIGKEAFPMDENHFFYVKYDYKGESIAKQLSFEDNYLLIKKDQLFKVDEKPIPVDEKEMTLFYRDDETKKSYKINTFTPVFPDLNELKNEVKMLIDELGECTAETKLGQITAYVNDFYGKPQKDNLMNWLEQEFDLTIEQKINFK